MRLSRRSLVTVLAVTTLAVAGGGVAAVTAGAAPPDARSIPFDTTITGKATYYDDAGLGACGTSIDAAHQMLAAVSHVYWTASNPNTDPLCSGVSVRLTYRDRTVTVPVVDKCPSCDAGHVDLSKAAFAVLEDPDVGVLNGATWSFVRSDGAGGAGASSSAPRPTSEPASPSVTSAPSPSTPSASSSAPSAGPATTGPGSHRRWWWRGHHRPSTSAPAASPTPARPSTPAGSSSGSSSAPASGTTIDVLVTGYGWWDNTPPGSAEISNPVLHRTAGGTGTYADPITVAVPYHCTGGGTCLQWPAGTRFYLPSLQRYLIVEDTCGDGGPDSCPDSTGNHLDVWVDGRSLSHAASDACEERITGRTTAILSPPAGLPVTAGAVCG